MDDVERECKKGDRISPTTQYFRERDQKDSRGGKESLGSVYKIRWTKNIGTLLLLSISFISLFFLYFKFDGKE